ncbi:MAG TPA: hypothetical protein VF786_13045, partial [Terriglobales bacterium]
MNQYRRLPHTTAWIALVLTAAIALLVDRLMTTPKPVYSAQVQLTRSTSGVASPDHWDFSSFAVTYQINPTAGANVIGGSGPAIAAIQNAFATWQAAPNANLQVSPGGNSALTT